MISILLGLVAIIQAAQCVTLAYRIGKLRRAIALRDAIIGNREKEIARLRGRLGFEVVPGDAAEGP